jgi:hypothetical protein
MGGLKSRLYPSLYTHILKSKSYLKSCFLKKKLNFENKFHFKKYTMDPTMLHLLFDKDFNSLLEHNLQVQKEDSITDKCIDNSLIHKYNCENHIFRITNERVDIYKPTVGICIILGKNGTIICWHHCWLTLGPIVIECSLEVLEKRKSNEYYYFDSIKAFKEQFSNFTNDFYKERTKKVIDLQKALNEYEPKLRQVYRKVLDEKGVIYE